MLRVSQALLIDEKRVSNVANMINTKNWIYGGNYLWPPYICFWHYCYLILSLLGLFFFLHSLYLHGF